MPLAHVAIDLGASSGRAIVGVLDGSPWKLRLEEVHRFEHFGCPSPVGPVWDLTGIWNHILAGIDKAAIWCKQNNTELKGIGVDTWGVDWALIGSSGELLALPHCYRDPQNDIACEKVLEKLGGFDRLYDRTGIQLMSLNTIFQLAARFESEPKLFDVAKHLIFLPDLFHYWLSGEITTERSIASTSSLLDVHSGDWDKQLLEMLELPTHVLGPIIEPGTKVGNLRAELANSLGVERSVAIIAPAAHDTGSAVAAVPATGKEEWAYLSSGTWSLLGAELSQPIVSSAAREIPFTNERGANDTIRFLKNIGGLWLIQELRREFERQGDKRSFAELVIEARDSESGRTIIDPGFPDFGSPGNMPNKIQNFAIRTDQPVPENVGQLVRCCLESLALCYSETLSNLESVLGKKIDVLHLVGGGSKNELLNEFTAAAVGRKVITGPVEATAIGNLLLQAMGSGELSGLSEIREVVSNSFPLLEVEQKPDSQWDEMHERYSRITSS